MMMMMKRRIHTKCDSILSHRSLLNHHSLAHNFTTSQVVYTTAMINHVFITYPHTKIKHEDSSWLEWQVTSFQLQPYLDSSTGRVRISLKLEFFLRFIFATG